MKEMASRVRLHAKYLCYALVLFGVTARSPGANKAAVAGAKVDQLVIASLSHQGAAKLSVLSHVDLTQPFGTVTQWTFVAVQEDGQPTQESDERGPVHVCFVKGSSPDCSDNIYQHVEKSPPFDIPYHFLASSVVYAGQDHSNPLLFVQLCTSEMFNGNCGVATALYRYEGHADRFVRVFQSVHGRNNNEATRFVEQGPLQGNVIVDYPTGNAPFTYWIEMYKAVPSGQYVQALHYRGHTRYGDGNPLAVADSEMPQILSRLGLWKPGDALPVPPHMPKGCSHLYMQKDEEWCK